MGPYLHIGFFPLLTTGDAIPVSPPSSLGLLAPANFDGDFPGLEEEGDCVETGFLTGDFLGVLAGELVEGLVSIASSSSSSVSPSSAPFSSLFLTPLPVNPGISVGMLRNLVQATLIE